MRRSDTGDLLPFSQQSDLQWAIEVISVKFMVIETFKSGKKNEVYERYELNGRMLPAGLIYVSSWLEVNGNRCFQLMESDRPELVEQWTRNWKDLVDFEIIPVSNSPTSSTTTE